MLRSALLLTPILLATAAVYAPVVGFGFVTWDDPLYVTDNETVQRGLHAEGLAWALGSRHDSNWIPLTWLSHMLDVSLYGDWGGGHHATNLLLHALCTALLFALLARTTGERGPSALVAALFALHPLHVEAVAWVSQRKELLAAAFGLGAALAHASAARRGGALRHAAVGVLFACALASKPMWVTLPFALLLLDVWPLGRTRLFSPPGAPPPPGLGRLLLEKLPLFALSLAASAATFGAQALARGAAPEIPVGLRLANAAVAPFRYLAKTLWPTELSILYPHPWAPAAGGEPFSVPAVAAAALALAGITAWTLFEVRRRPWAAVGWLWFLGMLVPVSGLVQVGTQGMADRYSYVPLIGVFVVLAWGARNALRALAPRRPGLAVLAAALAGVALTALAVRARHRVLDWRDSESLYLASLAATPRSPVLHYNLGVLAAGRGDREAARGHYEAALAIDPVHPAANNNLANLLLREGRADAALPHYEAALRGDPDDPLAHHNLGRVLLWRGDVPRAAQHLERALALSPDDRRIARDLAAAQAALAPERGDGGNGADREPPPSPPE